MFLGALSSLQTIFFCYSFVFLSSTLYIHIWMFVLCILFGKKLKEIPLAGVSINGTQVSQYI